MTNDVRWLPRSWYPVRVGYCPDERAWGRFLREHVRKTARGEGLYPSTAAAATTFAPASLRRGGSPVILVTLRADLEGDDLICMLVHECVHVWEGIMAYIEEDRPGEEIKAYGLEDLVRQMLEQVRQ